MCRRIILKSLEGETGEEEKKQQCWLPRHKHSQGKRTDNGKMVKKLSRWQQATSNVIREIDFVRSGRSCTLWACDVRGNCAQRVFRAVQRQPYPARPRPKVTLVLITTAKPVSSFNSDSCMTQINLLTSPIAAGSRVTYDRREAIYCVRGKAAH